MEMIELYWLVTGKAVNDAVEHNETALKKLAKVEEAEIKRLRSQHRVAHCEHTKDDK